MKKAQTHALSYEQLNEAFKGAINALNNRHQHSIQEFEKCGYVNHMVEVGGALVPMDRAADDLAGNDPQMREIVMRRLAEKQRVTVMSPAEAWASHDKAKRKTFDGFVATQILGDELSQVVKVTANNEFFAQNQWSEEWLQYSAMVEAPDGTAQVFRSGEQLRVWVNPTNVNMALVCEMSGAYVGRARYMAPAPFHRPQEAHVSLGEVAKHRAKQMGRLASVVGGRLQREAERRRQNEAVFAEAAGAAEKAATDQMVEMAGEGGEIEEL